MTRLPHLARLCLIAALALGALVSRDEAAELAQVRIGTARTMSDSGYYLADALGFFRDEGIAVTLTGFNSAPR